MKIINTVTKETVCEVVTNHSMSLDDAILLMGEFINPGDDRYSDDGNNVIICGNRYFYDDLEMEW